MVKRTILQVPIKPELKAKAEKKADAEGFSSLQDVVRMMLSRYTTDEISFVLSDKAARRYKKIIEDARIGKNVSPAFDNVEDALKYLNGVNGNKI